MSDHSPTRRRWFSSNVRSDREAEISPTLRPETKLSSRSAVLGLMMDADPSGWFQSAANTSPMLT